MRGLFNVVRWFKRQVLLAQITSYENELLTMGAGAFLTHRAIELRGLLALAYARLEFEEFA